MSELTIEQRNKLPERDFALPGRRYPIPDIIHARNALARVAEYGTEAEQHTVREAVYARYPSLREEDLER